MKRPSVSSEEPLPLPEVVDDGHGFVHDAHPNKSRRREAVDAAPRYAHTPPAATQAVDAGELPSSVGDNTRPTAGSTVPAATAAPLTDRAVVPTTAAAVADDDAAAVSPATGAPSVTADVPVVMVVPAPAAPTSQEEHVQVKAGPDAAAAALPAPTRRGPSNLDLVTAAAAAVAAGAGAAAGTVAPHGATNGGGTVSTGHGLGSDAAVVNASPYAAAYAAAAAAAAAASPHDVAGVAAAAAAAAAAGATVPVAGVAQAYSTAPATHRTDIDRTLLCEKCGVLLPTRAAMKLHLKEHEVDVSKVLRCTHPGCDYIGKSHGDFVRHRMFHAGSKLFKCSFPGCEYTTAYSGHLGRHRRVHLSNRPHKCSILPCTMSFATLDELVQHRKVCRHRPEAVIARGQVPYVGGRRIRKSESAAMPTTAGTVYAAGPGVMTPAVPPHMGMVAGMPPMFPGMPAGGAMYPPHMMPYMPNNGAPPGFPPGMMMPPAGYGYPGGMPAPAPAAMPTPGAPATAYGAPPPPPPSAMMPGVPPASQSNPYAHIQMAYSPAGAPSLQPPPSSVPMSSWVPMHSAPAPAPTPAPAAPPDVSASATLSGGKVAGYMCPACRGFVASMADWPTHLAACPASAAAPAPSST